jgi:hypothetical protein
MDWAARAGKSCSTFATALANPVSAVGRPHVFDQGLADFVMQRCAQRFAQRGSHQQADGSPSRGPRAAAPWSRDVERGATSASGDQRLFTQ